MAIKEDNRIFVNTNVLVYAAVSQAPFHAEARQAIHARRKAGDELWISRQVLREYLATLSRPQTFSILQPSEILIEDVRRFQDCFLIAEDGPAVTSRLLELLGTLPVGGKQIHDANIVATMLAYDIPAVLTHNADDYARFAGIIAVLPLAPAYDERRRVAYRAAAGCLPRPSAPTTAPSAHSSRACWSAPGDSRS